MTYIFSPRQVSTPRLILRNIMFERFGFRTLKLFIMHTQCLDTVEAELAVVIAQFAPGDQRPDFAPKELA